MNLVAALAVLTTGLGLVRRRGDVRELAAASRRAEERLLALEVLAEDVTAHRHAEEQLREDLGELRRTEQRAEESVREIETFVSIASHEHAESRPA